MRADEQGEADDSGTSSAFGVPVVGELIARAILGRLQDDGSAADLAEGAVDSETIEQR